MATLASTTFDSKTSGEATTASTGASQVLGDAAQRQHSTAQTINGASVYFTGTVSGSYLQWDFATTQKVYARFYFRRETVSTMATPSAVMCMVRSNSLQNAKLGWAPDTGALQVFNVSSVVATYPITTGQWYRVDWSIDQSVSEQAVRLYTGATIHSPNTADAVAGGTPVAVNATGLLNRLLLGQQLAVDPAVNFYVDELEVDNATLPAPFVPPAPAGLTYAYWLANGDYLNLLVKEGA